MIRRVKGNELTKLMELEREIFGQNPWTEEELRDNIKNKEYDYLVVDVNKELVGFARLAQNSECTQISAIGILEEYRDLGYGQKLLNAINDTIKVKRECWKYSLIVRRSNAVAINMYTKCGYKKVDEIKCYYPDDEDAIIMEKVSLK